MKHKNFWFVAGLAVGALGLVLVRRYRKGRAETLAWQQQQQLTLDVLACPVCHRGLKLQQVPTGLEPPAENTDPGRSVLHCDTCKKDYPIVEGIPHFIEPRALSGMNQRFARMYDWFSWGYRAFSKVAFAYIGMTEEQARREVTDRLDPMGGRVLEVSIGPGVNLPYLVGRLDVGELFGLDISLGQLRRCQDFVAHKGWHVQLHLGNAEKLPYPDNAFDGVFHIGGINFFNDKKKAIAEMIRVAKPGTRILICDENEKGAQAYERFLPSFKRTAGRMREAVVAPVALVPSEIQELRVFDVWNSWMYCIEFRKP